MKSILASLVFLVLILSCKSSKIEEPCKNIINKSPLNINSFTELVTAENDKREISIIVLDGKVASQDLVEKLIFNNSKNKIVSAQSVKDPNAPEINGKRKRVLIIYSTICGQWKLKKSRLTLKED
ncbi:hypothetical protein [Olleya sp. Hel_I_94]|uniref:hypothetical protein n=1 Tax=Olleya sp. Hel_I_94 TaxID=1250001 RepID=UPI00119D0445|nr:hypothetical protein [Olleya sp. Hel_I_94]TVZ47604.1 hypothetical protein JM82_2219 [Olleya sp. Hel_I_94]